MASINDIKSRIQNVKQTEKILRAMYLMSSINLGKIRDKQRETKKLFDKIRFCILDIIERSEDIDSIYFERSIKKEEEKQKIYLILTGDNGLAGGYNHNIIKAVDSYITDTYNSKLLIAGYMGKKLIKKEKYQIDEKYDYFVHNPTILRAKEMTERFLQMYNDHDMDELYVIYTDMISSFKQEVKRVKLLPIDITDLEEEIKRDKKPNSKILIKYEPSPSAVFDSLIPLYLRGVIYSLLVDAYASEQSARVVAMNSATSNAKKLIKRLKIDYNKQRQDNITKEIIEVTSHD